MNVEPEAPARKGGSTLAGASGSALLRRVLVVDDNRDGAHSLAVVLHLWGHEVQVTHDAPAALVAVRAEAPEVVLLDVGLPVMDGCELAQRLRAEPATAQAVLVALTGYGRDEDRQRTRTAGCVSAGLKGCPSAAHAD